ncbi:MAG: serine/threonine protein kinase [Xanthomonadales bacterium]|nr:serine/threonine protein kinase [Xanthomonadales bacterium]
MIEIPGYRLLRQLGRGGTATVYLALQESVAREVALKLMSPALLADAEFGARFLREARIAAQLHHRHVVGIHDVGCADDHHYIAMEYLGGGPVVARGAAARALPFALRVTREIASALHYAHQKGFVHRDVKPDNILLRDDGSAVLTDFGIARALDIAARVTRTGAVIGTPHYMSPEQARGREVDGRSDLYALGIVLHEMLLGRVPYHADDALAIGIMHLTEPLPTLPARLAPVQPLLDRLLAKQPEERFQTGEEVVAAISRLERESGDGTAGEVASPRGMHALPRAGTPRPAGHRTEPGLGRIDEIAAELDAPRLRAEGPRPPSKPRRRKHHRRVVLVALLAVLAIAALGFWSGQDALRQLLPRTGLNETLAQAQRALDAGRLDGGDDSARELFLAARAQDPDNDIARSGLQQVGQRLLSRAAEALAANDLAGARSALDGARELLGGGSEVERLQDELRRRETHEAGIAGRLEAANAALAAGKVLGTDGAAALFQQVLAAEPGNALAQAGLHKAAERLAGEARAALDRGDADAAAARADDIARIVPAYPRLPELFGRIAQLRDQERVASDKKLDRAEAALAAGRISGAADAALELFREVLQADPASARATAGLRQVARAELGRADAAIEAGDAAAAAQRLADATRLAPDLPGIAATRKQLRELEERDAIDAERAPVTAERSAEVRRLVAAGDAATAAGHIILPPGDSAWDRYRAALAIDGNDAAALGGLARLSSRARELLADALAEGAPLRARTLLDAIAQVDPADPALPRLRERVASAFLDQADARLVEGRHEEAARAAAAARELSPGNPRLPELERRLRQLGLRG